MSDYEMLHGDCLEKIKELPDCSVDAVVTDPPAGIAFMNCSWDTDKGGRREWIAWLSSIMGECLRVLKPGGHAFVWALPRTSHWTATALEDAGFEVRECVVHLFGSGFPKSHSVSRALDKLAVTDASKWEGFGTALKPASEHWWLCRKPLIGTVAQNVLAHGTGAINVDGCRVESGARPLIVSRNDPSVSTFGDGLNGSRAEGSTALGRWPPNVIFSHLPECHQVGTKGVKTGVAVRHNGVRGGAIGPPGAKAAGTPDMSYAGPDGLETVEAWECAEGCAVRELDEQSGGASRFFPAFQYQAKAPAKERKVEGVDVRHVTQKPVELMRWLVRLVTPPCGVVLDPFTGSGTTGVAAILEGFRFVGCEREDDYFALAKARIDNAVASLGSKQEKQPMLFDLEGM